MIGDGPGISPSENASVIRKMVESPFWRLIFKVAGSGALIEAGTQICNVHYKPNPTEEADYKSSYANRIPEALQWFIDYQKSINTVDPLLEKIEMETLIFWGENDCILYKSNGERLHKRMKNSTLNIFDNCGHFAYQDRYQDFAEMMMNWIDKKEISK